MKSQTIKKIDKYIKNASKYNYSLGSAILYKDKQIVLNYASSLLLNNYSNELAQIDYTNGFKKFQITEDFYKQHFEGVPKYQIKDIEDFAIKNIEKYKKFCKLSCYEPLLLIGKYCYNINLFKEVYNILRSEDKNIELGIIEQKGIDVLYFANNFASAILLPIRATDEQKQSVLNKMNDFCYGGLANASCEEKNL